MKHLFIFILMILAQSIFAADNSFFDDEPINSSSKKAKEKGSPQKSSTTDFFDDTPAKDAKAKPKVVINFDKLGEEQKKDSLKKYLAKRVVDSIAAEEWEKERPEREAKNRQLKYEAEQEELAFNEKMKRDNAQAATNEKCIIAVNSGLIRNTELQHCKKNPSMLNYAKKEEFNGFESFAKGFNGEMKKNISTMKIQNAQLNCAQSNDFECTSALRAKCDAGDQEACRKHTEIANRDESFRKNSAQAKAKQEAEEAAQKESEAKAKQLASSNSKSNNANNQSDTKQNEAIKKKAEADQREAEKKAKALADAEAKQKAIQAEQKRQAEFKANRDREESLEKERLANEERDRKQAEKERKERDKESNKKIYMMNVDFALTEIKNGTIVYEDNCKQKSALVGDRWVTCSPSQIGGDAPNARWRTLEGASNPTIKIHFEGFCGSHSEKFDWTFSPQKRSRTELSDLSKDQCGNEQAKYRNMRVVEVCLTHKYGSKCIN